MTNELLFFITILASFAGVVIFYRFWGKTGLFCWMAFASIVANIETIKCVDMFGMSVTLGTVLYSSNFLCTDILHENHGGKESRKAVKIGFAALIAFIVLEQLTLLFLPNDADFADEALHTIFGMMPRLCAASLITFFITNMVDTYLYGWFSSRTKKVWIRNNCSTMLSQALDTILFVILAFAGVYDWNILCELMLTTYIIKWIVAICDTPFIYLSKRFKKK